MFQKTKAPTMKTFLTATAFGLAATAAAATPVTLDYQSASAASTKRVIIESSPVPIPGVTALPTRVGAYGFVMRDVSGDLGDFVAFCVDLANALDTNGTADYTITDDPFDNTFKIGRDRVQALFDSNYASVDVTDGVQAAAFQLALWEVVYDSEFDLDAGSVQGRGAGSDAAAITATAGGYLSAAASYAGGRVWDLTFLEGTGAPQSQNIVTASLAAVPLPAGGLLLVAALGGLGGLRQGRREV